MSIELEDVFERLRNAKYAFKRAFFSAKMYSLKQYCEIIGADVPPKMQSDLPIAFAGCFNDFFNTYGKNSLYFLFEKDPDWFAKKACRHGAVAIVTQRQISNLPCILVEDTWAAFIRMCKFFYQKANTPVTAIAGSIGKTTTTEMIMRVYKTHYKTFCTPINGNVARYVGYIVQRIPKSAQQYVQEVDESYPNNTAYCSQILNPKVVAITNIDKSHVGELGGEEQIAKSILALTDSMAADGLVIINADDPKSRAAEIKQRLVTVAINHPADYWASDIASGDACQSFTLNHLDKQYRIRLNCVGQHNIYNAMMSFAAGEETGVPTRKIIKGLSRYRSKSIRQHIYRVSEKTYYMDCCNASARSIDAALHVTDSIQPKKSGRRIAVLGDIDAIESYEEEIYSAIGKSITESKTDIVITYGRFSNLISRHIDTQRIKHLHFSEKPKLVEYL